MGLFTRLAWGKTVQALDAWLGPQGARPVGVVDAPELARLLGERRPVLALGGDGPPGEPLGSLILGAGKPADPVAHLRTWAARVDAGGRVALLERAPRSELARRVLCAHLVDLEQRTVGGKVLTLARVRNTGRKPA
jgi:hypothetical protein